MHMSECPLLIVFKCSACEMYFQFTGELQIFMKLGNICFDMLYVMWLNDFLEQVSQIS